MNTDKELHTQLAMTVQYHSIYTPLGFTIDVKTLKLVEHGVPVGGYHSEPVRNGFEYPTSPHWMVVPNDLHAEHLADALLELIGENYDLIVRHGHVGGWRNDAGELVLDIVKLHPCFTHGNSADGILEGQRLRQVAVGWLCPDLGGYKEVTL